MESTVESDQIKDYRAVPKQSFHNNIGFVNDHDNL